ncbi:transposase [Streptomyces olivoreticuli]|uniref:transposase n=1 Tax=Streptomyces olivoreticuli TaxID=68246 RepID=UPI00265A41FF|nr:transposase [Streptomyces olivoreticuli]WKK24083.1 transposase [Streptomyces olivoreticuli]
MGRNLLALLLPISAWCSAGNVDGKGRHITRLPRPIQEIQNRARLEQRTEQWQRRYAIRSGCEATVSETVHAHGLHCRYRRAAKTHVQHVLTAAGTSLVRLSDSYEATSACPATCVVTPGGPTNPKQDS